MDPFPCDTSPGVHSEFIYRPLGRGKCRIGKCTYWDRIDPGCIFILIKHGRAAIRAKMVAGPHAAITRPLVKPRMPFDSYIGLWVPSLDREGTTRSTLAFQAVQTETVCGSSGHFTSNFPHLHSATRNFILDLNGMGAGNHDFFLSALGLCAALARTIPNRTFAGLPKIMALPSLPFWSCFAVLPCFIAA